MTDEREQPDPPLNFEQEAVAASLSAGFIRKIDLALLSHAKPSWRKVAMLVGLTMMEVEDRRSD